MKFVMMWAAIALTGGAAAAQDTVTFNVQERLPLEAKILKGAPYSADMTTDHTQVLGDGNRIVQHSSGRVYRDAEGRVRREEDRASGGASVSIVDPVAGVSYVLDPDRRVAWKSSTQVGFAIAKKLENAATLLSDAKLKAAAKPEEPAGTARRAAKEGASEVLPPKTIEGVRAEGRRTTTTIAAGVIGNELPITIVSEEWRSPDLQVLVLTDRKDPRNGDSTYRLLHIVRGDPDAALFQVPSDYEVREGGIKRFER
jgi:hypothetical protein